MQHNLRVELEKNGNRYVGVVEVSGTGRSGIRHIRADSFEDAVKQMNEHHEELVGHVQSFHEEGPRHATTHHSEAALLAQAAAKPTAPATVSEADREVDTEDQQQDGGESHQAAAEEMDANADQLSGVTDVLRGEDAASKPGPRNFAAP